MHRITSIVITERTAMKLGNTKAVKMCLLCHVVEQWGICLLMNFAWH